MAVDQTIQISDSPSNRSRSRRRRGNKIKRDQCLEERDSLLSASCRRPLSSGVNQGGVHTCRNNGASASGNNRIHPKGLCDSITCYNKITASRNRRRTLTLTATACIASASHHNPHNAIGDRAAVSISQSQTSLHETFPCRSNSTTLARALNATLVNIQSCFQSRSGPDNAVQMPIGANHDVIEIDILESLPQATLRRCQKRRRLCITGKTEIAPGVFIAASCQQQWHMWNACNGTSSLTQKADDSVSHTVALNDMILDADLSPIVQNQEMIYCNQDEDIDLLRCHYSRGDVVIESPDSNICPHIAISPVQDTTEDYYVPFSNRVDLQWPGFLMVPPCYISPSRLFLPLPQLHPQTSGDYISSEDSTFISAPEVVPSTPLPVFSASKFNHYVFDTSDERINLCCLVNVLHKIQVKAAVMAAASLALSLRERFDDPGYLSSFERPFCWSDPAEPIIIASKNVWGTLFIESSNPFAVPHIMINSPPPQDPNVFWMNATNNPQDAQFGRYLTVPFRLVHYINLPREDYESSWSYDEIAVESRHDDEDSMSSSASEEDFLSLPGTPMEDSVEAVFDGYDESNYLALTSLNDSNGLPIVGDYSSFLEPSVGLSKLSAKLTNHQGKQESWSLNDYEDSDDDLPPFDDWYQSIAFRQVS